jgi:hypothetical protein
MNYNNPNYIYPNLDTNFNQNFNANLNASNQNFNAVPICSVCKGTGFYILNGTNVPCQCPPYTSSTYQPQNTMNYNMNYEDIRPSRHIEGRNHHHPHHKNIFSRTFHGIKDCINCAGKGFINAFTNSGHEKVCYECIRNDGFCPVCENTGFKLHNGKPCKCGLLN